MIVSGAATFSRTEVSRLAYRWQANPPPQPVEVCAGRVVGERLAAEIESRTRDLRRLDDHVGGRDLAGIVAHELRLSVEVVRDARYTAATGRRLLAAVSDQAQLAGWVAPDSGRLAEASKYYALGMSAGHAADDSALVASSLSSLAYQTANSGDRYDAVLMAATAVRGTPTAVPAAKALYAERLAWTHARVGDADSAEQALDLIDDTFGAAADGTLPTWAYWLTRDEINVMRARIGVELHRPEPAIGLLTAALDRYPAGHVREVSLYRSYLAHALVLAGEHTEACRVAAELVEAGSARAGGRVEHLRHLLAT